MCLKLIVSAHDLLRDVGAVDDISADDPTATIDGIDTGTVESSGQGRLATAVTQFVQVNGLAARLGSCVVKVIDPAERRIQAAMRICQTFMHNIILSKTN